PLFSTSAESNVGVARLMDFIARYGSSPVDRETVTAVGAKGDEVELSLAGQETVLYVFKTLGEAHLGELSFFRVYSGTLKSGSDLYNSERKSTEKIGQIYLLNGKNRTSVKTLHGGDIGAAVKLKDTHTGNTLCSSKQVVTLPKVEFPKPNIHAALKAKSKGDEDKISTGLAAIHEEDPTFLYRSDPELRQMVISGQGDLHLQTVCESLKRRFNVEIELIEPKIPYRETIKSRGESKYRHKKQSGGAGQFAEVWMRVEPKQRGEGIEFTESLRGQNVDRVFVPSVEKGVNAASKEGVLAGYRVVDVKVDFYDGKQHPVDSKDIAFQIAGKQAFKEAVMSAKPCLLEPICTVEIKVPEECMGDVMGDISSRRGKILGMDSSNGFQVIRAQVPQAELYRYSTTLRSMTGGRGMYAEEFSHYEELAHDLVQKVIAESKNKEE
ncbi:MAG: elongation factor G, partial [Thermodesulfobacteriota bacterium]